MVYFGVRSNGKEVLDSIAFDKFMELSNQRLNSKTIVFSGDFKKVSDWWLVEMCPLMFPFYLFGLMGVVSTLYLAGLTWYLLPSVIVSCTGLFWSKYFYYFMLRVGLLKINFNGSVKLLSNDEVISLLVSKKL